MFVIFRNQQWFQRSLRSPIMGLEAVHRQSNLRNTGCSLHHKVYFTRNIVSTKNTSEAIQTFEAPELKRIEDRIRSTPHRPINSLKRAGVIIPLCHDLQKSSKPSLLFTLRSNNVGTHKGQVSFPGGMLEQTDKDIVACALREMEEEIGLQRHHTLVLGSCHDALSITNIAVTPIVGYIGKVDISQLIPNRTEIDDIFTVVLEDLVDHSKIAFKSYERGTLPVFSGGKHIIWGLTAYFLYYFMKDILKVELPPIRESVDR